MFTKYGYFTIAVVVLMVLVMLIFSFIIGATIGSLLIILSIILLLFTLNFFRDPERTTPIGENVIFSPADGKILIIKDVQCDRFIEGPAKQISIFMSPLNVHVNRIPISGRVDYLKYIPGKFLKAYADKADSENERTEIGITGNSSKVLFTQVAGFVARRIICDLKEGSEVVAGERFGMIKFGSRVDVIVPPEWTTTVSEGMHVTAGETILFEKNK